MRIKWSELTVTGCYSAKLQSLRDHRGSFQKLFNTQAFENILPNFVPHECYITCSEQGVLRGMHFQLPPDDHDKLVFCLGGHALDVVVDLRPGSNYGATASVDLTPGGINCVAMPAGVGHGFYALSENTQLLYLVGTDYSPESDAGILWNSIDFDWPVSNPIISDRDKSHPSLDKFMPPEKWYFYE